MNVEDRRASYSIARMLEEVQEQKTKEQQLQRQSGIISDSGEGFEGPPASTAGAQEVPAGDGELQFKPGFVSQLLGKFGGQSATSASPGGRLRKTSSTQNLSPTGSGAASPTTYGGIVLRRQPADRGAARHSSQGDSASIVARRRSSQDVGGVSKDAASVNGNGSHVFVSGGKSSPSSSPSASSSSHGNRVLIIPKTSASPVVKRWQQQQQQPQQQALPSPEPPKSPAAIPVSKRDSEENSSFPIKNMVQAKRSLFEKQQQQQATTVSHASTNGGVGMATVAKPAVGRGLAANSPSTKQILPRPVEIVKATPSSPSLPAAASSLKSSATAKPILPSRPSIVPAVSMTTATKTTTTTTKTVPSANQASSASRSDDDGYGFGLPVPKLKSSMPFNGENLKRVALNEKSVVAMRKAGKSWFFGTDVGEAPEGSIAVKLTANERPFSLAEDDESRVNNDADELTEERRAQTTVWDHVRNADSGRQRVDPGLAAEARRLMASAGDDGGADDRNTGGSSAAASIAARGKKKALCFKRDSVLEETFEYQSEQSLIQELRITPDYPTGPFELVDSPPSPTINEEGEAASATANGTKKVEEAGQNKQAANGPRAVVLRSSGTPTPLATYKSKLEDDFVWGARRSSSMEENQQQQQQQQQQPSEAPDSVDGGPVDDPDAQWSSSASADLLF